jgi:tellurite methyltransferase
MMSPERRLWESRHREAPSHASPDPAAFLVESFPVLPRPHARSRALDLACGGGRNAVWLAERGWPVVAVDYAPAALDRAAALAAARGIPATRSALRALPQRFSGLCLVEADLTSFPLPHSAFDLILCFHYLDRHAFPRIERALAPGGFLLYETFTEHQRAFPEGPRSPEHLLAPGELRSAFPALESLFYREWTAGRALASLLARKPC